MKIDFKRGASSIGGIIGIIIIIAILIIGAIYFFKEIRSDIKNQNSPSAVPTLEENLSATTTTSTSVPMTATTT